MARCRLNDNGGDKGRKATRTDGQTSSRALLRLLTAAAMYCGGIKHEAVEWRSGRLTPEESGRIGGDGRFDAAGIDLRSAPRALHVQRLAQSPPVRLAAGGGIPDAREIRGSGPMRPSRDSRI